MVLRELITSIAADFIFRAGIMYMSNDGELGQQMRSNMFSLSGTGFFGAIGRCLNLGKIYVFVHIVIMSCTFEAKTFTRFQIVRGSNRAGVTLTADCFLIKNLFRFEPTYWR